MQRRERLTQRLHPDDVLVEVGHAHSKRFLVGHLDLPWSRQVVCQTIIPGDKVKQRSTQIGEPMKTIPRAGGIYAVTVDHVRADVTHELAKLLLELGDSYENEDEHITPLVRYKLHQSAMNIHNAGLLDPDSISGLKLERDRTDVAVEPENEPWNSYAQPEWADADEREYERLSKYMESCQGGDRPISPTADKLRRFMALQDRRRTARRSSRGLASRL